MKTSKVAPFKVIGIKITTTNENSQSAIDIGKLWERFLSERIIDKIPNKVDNSILSIYTNYQGDHTKPYDVILGCKVKSIGKLEEGMIAKSFEGGEYVRFISKGNLSQGVVYNTWEEIWNAKINRSFLADFEIYGEKAQNPENAEVEIFVGIKDN